MHYVYLIKNVKFNEIYVGSTNDLEQRIKQHNGGQCRYTKRYSPWKLVYYEAYLTEKLAREREKNLKYHGKAMAQLKKRLGLDF